MKYFSRNQGGFSLVEIMVAVVVLAIGLLGLAKFQSELTRSAAETKTRASALALAERKLEDLRAFSEVITPATPVVDTFYFDEIAANAGGTESGGSLNLPAATYTIGGEVYTLSWTLAAVPIAGTQEINVNVAWVDLDGPQSVNLTGIISSTAPAAASPISGAAAVTIEDPQISYTPGLAPDVISIDVDTGNNRKKETSKPLPDVFHTGDYNRVTFDVVTYNSVDNEVERREQFVSVNCLCTSSSGQSLTPAYTVFENITETIHDVEGTLVTKNTGVVANNQQPLECVACCRDHSDSVTGTSGAGETIAYGTTNYDPSNDYAEVCRMKYVNGKLRVFQDWNLSTLTVFADSYVSDSNPTTQTLYKTYVTDYVKDTSTAKPTNTVGDTNTRSIELLPGANKQLLARSIYIDTVYNATAATPTYATFLAQKITDGDADTLQFIPFFEINSTKLANWVSDDCGEICVRSDAIVDESLAEDNYTRGLVSASNTAVGPATITAKVNLGNSGVVGEADATSLSDSITTTILNVANFSLSGDISFCSGLNGPEKNAVYAALQAAGVNYSGDRAGTCTINSKQGNAGSYSCDGILEPANVQVDFPAAAFPTPASSSVYSAGNTSVDFEICDS